MNKLKLLFLFSTCSMFAFVQAQTPLEPIELNEEWKSEIQKLAPSQPSVEVPEKKMLIFSLHTGFYHWAIPHTEYVIKTISEKSNTFEVITSKTISSFNSDYLNQFDVVVLNNTCSKRDYRNIFLDVILQDSTIAEKEAMALAESYEKNLLKYVANGGGLVLMHGAIVMQNNSIQFSKMVGGSFDYHPPQQKLDVKLSDPKHPILESFNGEGFTHIDEPYFFIRAYEDYDFRPLLYIETDKISGIRHEENDKHNYIAWIKPYGLGKVFYSSPSHNAQSFSNPKLLKFLLNGIQYAAGDLQCDDSPIGKKR